MNPSAIEANQTSQAVPDVLVSDQLAGEEQVALSARIDMYAVLADIFRFPDETTRQYVREGGFKDNVQRIIENLPYAVSMDEQEKKTLTYPQDLTDDDVEAEFIRLFEAGPGNPPCPLVEGLHLDKESGRKAIFKDLILFYNHFGLSYAEGNTEDRPDHIIYELEFLHYLAFLELTAIQKGRDAGPLRRAQKDFLERHLSQWTGMIADRTQKIEAGLREGVNRDAIAFYRNVIVLTDRFVTCDLAHIQHLTAN